MAPRRSRLPTLPAWTLALLAWSVGSAPDLAAQRDRDAPAATLAGVVVDASSGARIPGAAILLADRERRAFTDRAGRFAMGDLRPGSHTVIVAQLGYDTLRTELHVGEGSAPVTLRLAPDPVVLERVTAMVDRFRERRNSIGTSVRAFDRLGLQSTASYNVLDFVLTRANLVPTACPSRVAMAPCAYVRGRATEVQVIIDDTRIVSGLDVLASFRPEELYALEVIGGGRAIRAYTNWYVETVAQGRRLPSTFLF